MSDPTPASPSPTAPEPVTPASGGTAPPARSAPAGPLDPFDDVPRARSEAPRRGGPLGALLLVAGLGAATCLLLAVVSLAGVSGGAPGTLVEEVLEGEGDDKVVLVELSGVIAAEQPAGLFGGSVDLVERFRRELEQAAGDPAVKGLLLSIDSPGGTVTASDELWHAVRSYRQKTLRPVVVHMGALCASGGYYVAAAANEVVAGPTTITGSIGVVLGGLNFHGLLREHGVQDVTITSGANKDLLNPTAPLRDEHRAILQALVDETHGRFVEIVAEGRKLPLEDVRALADGRIYTATQAKAKGLVDAIGYREEALARVVALSGAPSARLVRYRRPPSLADVLAGDVQAATTPRPLDAAALLDQLRTPRLLALWRGAGH